MTIRTPAAAIRPAEPPTAADAAEAWGFRKGDELAPGRTAVRLLGGGERYETYLGWDDRLLALCVVKILRPHLVDDARALRGLAAEARLLETLAHPVLVRSFAAELDGPRPHVVLEHLEGPRLSTLVRRFGPLEREQLLPLGLQLCSVLHYLAGEGIAHLDVKPSNIIMGAPARLIDLSIARPLADLAGLRRQLGTDAYMAPEQCDPTGRGPITAAADVWGVGATLHHAVSGRPPFDTTSGAGSYPQLTQPPRPLPEKVPQRVRELIEACLDPDPRRRPTPAGLASELELLVDALPRRPIMGRLRVRTR